MIKRRDFLKKTGMLAMATTFPGIVSAEIKNDQTSEALDKSKIKVDNQWDVIVVGGGPAGCAAATAAARCLLQEAGANTKGTFTCSSIFSL